MRNFVYLIFFFIFISHFFFISESQVVIDVTATCEVIDSSSPCKDHLNYTQIYIPTGYTQALITSQTTALLQKASVLPDANCLSNLTNLLCISAYMECNQNISNITPSFPLPSYPCKKYCDKVSDVCSAYMALIGVDCSMVQNGNPFFPQTSTEYNLTKYGGSSNEEIQCSNPNLSSNSTTAPSNFCPPPLIWVDSETIENNRAYQVTTPNCVLPCPVNVYTDKEYKTKFYSESILFSFSTACAFYLIFTFGVFPNKYTNRNFIIVYLGITAICLAISYAVQEARFGGGDWRCTSDPGRYKSSEDGTCILGGFFFQIGGLGTILFLSLYSFDMFLTMNMKTNNYFVHTSIGMWILIIFYALLPIKHYESSIASAGCWLSNEDKMFWQYFCFYVPSYIATFLMGGFIISSIYKVFKMAMLFKSIKDRSILFLNIRSIVFLIAIMFCVCFSSMYPLYVTYNGDDFSKSVEVWVLCLYQNVPNGGDVCPQIVFPQFSLRYLNAVTMAIIGIVGLIGLGIDPHILQIYRESTRFKYLLSLFGIRWGVQTPQPLKQNSNTTDSSSGSGGSAGGNTKENRKSQRKSRSVTIGMKKINLTASSESSNNLLNQSTNSTGNININEGITSIDNNTNNNDFNNNTNNSERMNGDNV
ncbi:hypothetical protein RB653_004686 [Dictyostelium firmibasis]|uniref:FZ domain-containing protein n=1 Tax=Dictyostelium firmibasis TaxID=79012 RepID=A0AAN7YXI3_9MYCE